MDVGSPFSGRTSGICTALGPLLLLASQLVSFVAAGETALSGALMLSGAAAFVPAVVAMGGVLRGPERRWGTVGTALALLGCLALACGAAVELVLAHLPTATTERALSAPLVSLAFGSVGPTFFYVGLLVLTLGLVRNGVAGSLGPGLAALGLLIVGVSRVVGGDILTLAGHVILLAGMVQVGRIIFAWAPRDG